ncbi:MAG TPA: NADH:flavin oxidoreductase [Chloroflexota bacterium]|nr:NADH:flavin oxidoreductase [Chloroflexota bacterium]
MIDPERAKSIIFQPLAIGRGGLAMQNRLWLPAMVTWRSTEQGEVTPDVRSMYLRYAMGGVGMIVLEAIGVRDVASGPLMRLGHDRYIPDLKKLVSEMHAAGSSLVIPQLIDFLKIATRKPTRQFMESAVKRGQLPETILDKTDEEFEAGYLDYLPDPRLRHDFLYGYRQTIHDLGVDEIRQIPIWFGEAARRAKEAGFDGVELHFAHAYTMASFLSITNQRPDEYGGCLENRLRLPREVIEEVRGQVGAEYLVGCRFLGSEDIQREDGSIDGNTLADAQQIGVEFARAGLDFLSVSRGGKFDDAKQPPVGEAVYPYTGHSGHVCMPRDKKAPFGVNAHLAEGIRRAVRQAGFAIPVIGSGKIVTFDLAEQMLLEGKMDAVGMARALLADPDLPRKWLAGRDDAVRLCVFCPYCEDEDQHHRVVTCTLWPRAAEDRRKRLIPAVWQPDREREKDEAFAL